MRLRTVYCRPRTTIIDPAKHKYPYLLRNLEIQRPNQVWSLEISYIPMVRGYMYLLAIMDIYSRSILGWSLSNTMEAEDEYIGYVKSLETVRISMDGKGRAFDSVYIERFFRTIKDGIILQSGIIRKCLYQMAGRFINKK